MKKTRKNLIGLLVYVDDIAIGSCNQDEIHNSKVYLESQFKLKDLGKLRYFLGLEIARNTTGITVCQRKFSLDLVEKFGLLGTKPTETPISSNHKLSQEDVDSMEDPTTYGQLVGKLIYLTLTRPDLSYAVQVLSQFMAKPRNGYFKAALKVLKYIKGSP